MNADGTVAQEIGINCTKTEIPLINCRENKKIFTIGSASSGCP